MELSNVRGEREALQAGAAAPEVSKDDRLTALSEEMLKITKQNEDRRAEITALRSQDATRRAASEDTPHVRSTVWHLRRNLPFHLST